jgi:uncharacterized membrane protein
VTPPLVLSAGLLGVVAGCGANCRPPCSPSAASNRPPGPLKPLGTGVGRWTSYLAAAAELAADKLPATPSRVEGARLVQRVVSGAIAGAALASATGVRGSRLVVPVIAAGAGAWAGSWGGYLARRAARRTHRTARPPSSPSPRT